MSLLHCQCINCQHDFYSLQVDCRQLEVVLCPLCQGGVEIDDIKKPHDKMWGKCKKVKGKCAGDCGQCSK
ncbi:MAG: hypothetical protein WC570_04525 [Patescibacteria group bacterium]